MLPPENLRVWPFEGQCCVEYDTTVWHLEAPLKISVWRMLFFRSAPIPL